MALRRVSRRVLLRRTQRAYTESVLKVSGRHCPVAPALSVAVETVHTDFLLQEVVGCPGVARTVPCESDHGLFILVELKLEIILIVGKKTTARIVDDILGIAGGGIKIVLIAATFKAETGAGQKHFCKKAFG